MVVDARETLNLTSDEWQTPGPIAINLIDNRTAFNLRLSAGAQDTFRSEIEQRLPHKISEGVTLENGLNLLKLGPDEWICWSDTSDLTDFAAQVAGAIQPDGYSMVDISDRDVTVRVSGAQVLDLLAVGAPLNLSAFEAGSGRRTVFSGVQTLIYRSEPNSFTLTMWRSYFRYVWTLLRDANAELAAGL